MSGMATTVASNTSSYDNRTAVIEVTGALGDLVRTSNYRLKVPYRRMSDTVKQIHRMGRKISNITMTSYSINIINQDDSVWTNDNIN
ncbi:MAG: phycobilisome linker polypeptide [Cyanobacteria bacterium P01_D01_bin.50]